MPSFEPLSLAPEPTPPPAPVAATRPCGHCAWLDAGSRGLRHEAASLLPGQIIFREGEPCGRLALVHSGMVRLFQTLSGGRRQIVSFAVPGDVLNLSASATELSAEAVDAVTLCLLDRGDVERLVAQDADFGRRLLERASADLSRLRRQLSWIGRQTAEERISSFLLDLHRRAEPAKDGAPMLALPMSRQDIADHLGLAIETVSRILGRLAAEGSLAIVPGGVLLLDIERLGAAVIPVQPGKAPRYRSWKRPA